MISIKKILDKGALKKGLTPEETGILCNALAKGDVEKIFALASKIKEEIYGERLVLFAPLYISNFCVNECAYCGFHLANDKFKRRRLSDAEIVEETKCLIGMGHKRVLVEFGEDPDHNSIDYICNAIRTVYSVKTSRGSIRRVNVNIAATTVENYRRLKAENIGTYQLFQETYHRKTYEAVHKGPKGDFDRQLSAHSRAREAGLDDLGIGALFGLYDWKFEVVELVRHARRMEKELGVGPHTISVPRLKKAPGTFFKPEHPVSDSDFLKLVAVLRIAVPYTGLILSTREPPELRRKAFKLGISQASAASATFPGGYSEKTLVGKQFSVQDERTVDEVIKSVINDGLIPSFCTACYRVGRTGEYFMEFAKSGDIHKFCRPNALLTFAEYLEDFGDGETRKKGAKLIKKYLAEIGDEQTKEETKKRLADIKIGKRDLYF